MLNERWLNSFPGDPYLSIDEPMVPYYGPHGTKQHIYGKPIPLGYKVWAMATRRGYLVQAEPYQGASTGNTMPNLGVGGSVVVNLISELEHEVPLILTFDYLFSSVRLLDY